MKRPSAGRIIVIAGIVATAFAATDASSSALAGRYKKQGTKCLWDGNDSGPNQCEPLVKGRFKRSGETCVWSGGETGADECRPPKGRFKRSGAQCAWDGNDSGPDQCDPHRAR